MKKKLIQKMSQKLDDLINDKRSLSPFKDNEGNIFLTTKEIVLDNVKADLLTLKLSNNQDEIINIKNKYKYIIWS